MLANIIAFVPRMLLDERYGGAVMSMLLAVPLSTGLCSLLIYAMGSFPQCTVVDIFKKTLSVWIWAPVLIFFIGMWYLAGMTTLFSFADITKRFINPSLPPHHAMGLYAGLLVFMIQLGSRRALYTLELLLVLQVPLILFIMMKATFNENLLLDAIVEAGTYLFHMPSWQSLAAATYVFTGYLNLVIYNGVFHRPVKLRVVWIVLAVGLLNLTTTYFIPIGMHGMDGVGELLYMWFTTADSIRLEYGFVERLIFIFLLLYLNISLLSAFVHWHVALQLIKGFMPAKEKLQSTLSWIVGALFAVGGIATAYWMTEHEMFGFTSGWVSLRLASEIVLVAGIAALAWRERRKKPA